MSDPNELERLEAELAAREQAKRAREAEQAIEAENRVRFELDFRLKRQRMLDDMAMIQAEERRAEAAWREANPHWR